MHLVCEYKPLIISSQPKLTSFISKPFPHCGKTEPSVGDTRPLKTRNRTEITKSRETSLNMFAERLTICLSTNVEVGLLPNSRDFSHVLHKSKIANFFLRKWSFYSFSFFFPPFGLLEGQKGGPKWAVPHLWFLELVQHTVQLTLVQKGLRVASHEMVPWAKMATVPIAEPG